MDRSGYFNAAKKWYRSGRPGFGGPNADMAAFGNFPQTYISEIPPQPS